MESPVLVWWSVLGVVALTNLIAWGLSARRLQRLRGTMDAEALALRRALWWLSGVYVVGCAYRSAMPLFDVPRLCVYDAGVFTSSAVGRSVATVAEMCFVAQWVLLLRMLGRRAGSALTRAAAAVLLPLIAVAEASSWFAVLTQVQLGHAIENSLWGLGALIALVGLAALWPHSDAPLRRLIVGCTAGGLAFITFLAVVDVPMYWTRWLADEAAGRSYLSLAEGASDAWRRCTVTREWGVWRSEVPWMTLYFGPAVWFSIALVHFPALRGGAGLCVHGDTRAHDRRVTVAA